MAIRSLPVNELEPIENAISALQLKESKLTHLLNQTEEELRRTKSALASLRQLGAPIPLSSLVDSDELGDSQDASSPFAGLRFSQALHKFLLNKPPSTTSEIARGFEMEGWRFKTPNQNAKVNQIGVTLRRLEGKLFREIENKRWIALEEPILT